MTARGVEVLRRAWTWRPAVSVDMLALLAAAFFSLACNLAFWRSYAEAAGGLGSSAIMTASLFLAIFGVNVFLMSVLLGRRTAKVVLTGLLFVTAFAVYYMHVYGVYLDPDMVRNVIHTDSKESRELLTPGLVPWLAGYAVLPSVLLWRLRLRAKPWRKALLHRGVLAMGGLVVTAAALAVGFQPIAALMRNHRDLRHLITPGNYIVSVARVVQDAVKESPTRRIVGADARLRPHGERKPRLLVIVVGETVRAQNWGLNGYARNTTPQLARRDVVNFSDVTACGSSTEVSLPCMFSDIGRANYDRDTIRRSDSLLHVLHRAGIATAWLDNQAGCKGVCTGLPFTSLADAKDPQLCNAERCLDEILVDRLPAALRTGVDQVIVLHQLGNHGPRYFARYPSRFRAFTPTCDTGQLGDCTRQQIVNSYDNAILYTDHVLATLIDRLERDPTRDSAMIYVSDHGESLGEGSIYLHGMPYPIAPPTQLRVPMTVWLSPGLARSRGLDVQCLRARASGPVSHDNLFSSVLGLLDIQTAARDASLDLFGRCTAREARPSGT
jgi:lipid A ethanolaminephosphotransferase